MSKKYKYGKKETVVESAAGKRGIIIRSGNQFFFRIYQDDGEFIDYEIMHDDLEVIISEEAMASFYTNKEHHVLDHSPEVLGLENIPE